MFSPLGSNGFLYMSNLLLSNGVNKDSGSLLVGRFLSSDGSLLPNGVLQDIGSLLFFGFLPFFCSLVLPGFLQGYSPLKPNELLLYHDSL